MTTTLPISIDNNILIGKLLVSPPSQKSKHWAKKVILIHEQTSKYTSGIILNHKTNYTLKSIAEYHNYECDNDVLLYNGGYDLENAIIMLHSNDWDGDNTISINSRISISSDSSMIERICMEDSPKKWRLFLGLSQWKTSELQKEIDGIAPYSYLNSWLVCSINENILFENNPDKQWERAIDLAITQNSKRVFEPRYG